MTRETMTKGILAVAIGILLVLPVPLVLRESGLWAAPGMDRERQTVPTPGPPEPIDTPTRKPKPEPPEPPEPPPPAPTATSTYTPTSTPQPTATGTPAATQTPTVERSPTALPAVLTPTPTISPSPSPSPTAMPGWDFGDAPDPGFPSLLESEGVRHANVEFEWLGEGVDKEADSRQIDLDLFDDGVAFGELRACSEAEVSVKVSVQDRDDAQHPYDLEHLLILNVLADWDGDGRWEGGMTCPDGLVAWEWAVQNFPLDVTSWPSNETYAVVPLTLPVGSWGGETWIRFCLSYGEPVRRGYWDGGGEFAFGETEDYLVTVEPAATPVPGGGTPALPNRVVATVTRTAETLGIPTTVLCGAVFFLTAGLALSFAAVGYWVGRRGSG